MNNNGGKKRGWVKLNMLPVSALELRTQRMFLESVEKQRKKDFQSAKKRFEQARKNIEDLLNS